MYGHEFEEWVVEKGWEITERYDDGCPKMLTGFSEVFQEVRNMPVVYKEDGCPNARMHRLTALSTVKEEGNGQT
jgi:hypothetical protein